ncbi:MAG: sigma-54 dependent transcriptional regulator [Gammaproteobacteria bacterium]|nr:MAG: sigma-54 dependent transcriptional regulator [Gammaproteobacteria bacterium]
MSRADILVVDDEPDIRRLIKEILEDENYSVVTAENAAVAKSCYSEHPPDLVLLDIWMPDTDGITLLKEWSEDQNVSAPVVMMSGHGNVETAVEATRLGAFDFIEKPVSMGKLLLTVEHALQSVQPRPPARTQVVRINEASPLTGKSKLMTELRQTAEGIAQSDAGVLITGEPGTGKTLAARYIHDHSERRDHPIIEISLAATSPETILIQLFGSEHENKIMPGILEQSSGGTLLLTEIADLDQETQTRLFHMLEEGRFLRIGGHKAIDTNARIIATTSLNKEVILSSGRFREDLYYRLDVVNLHIPALREHREDIPELVNLYVNWFTENKRLPYRVFSTAIVNLMRNHYWPGNILELKNFIQHLLVVNRGKEVTLDEVTQTLQAGVSTQTHGALEGTAPLYELPLRQARDAFEKAYLEHHLIETGGNVSELAEIVGMERTHLYRKLKQLDINPKALKKDSQKKP